MARELARTRRFPCHVRGNWDVNGNVDDDESRTRTNCSFVRGSEISSCTAANGVLPRAERSLDPNRVSCLYEQVAKNCIENSREFVLRPIGIRWLLPPFDTTRVCPGQPDKHSPNRRNRPPFSFAIFVTKFAERTDLFRCDPSSGERVPTFRGGGGGGDLSLSLASRREPS